MFASSDNNFIMRDSIMSVDPLIIEGNKNFESFKNLNRINNKNKEIKENRKSNVQFLIKKFNKEIKTDSNMNNSFVIFEKALYKDKNASFININNSDSDSSDDKEIIKRSTSSFLVNQNSIRIGGVNDLIEIFKNKNANNRKSLIKRKLSFLENKNKNLDKLYEDTDINQNINNKKSSLLKHKNQKLNLNNLQNFRNENHKFWNNLDAAFDSPRNENFEQFEEDNEIMNFNISSLKNNSENLQISDKKINEEKYDINVVNNKENIEISNSLNSLPIRLDSNSINQKESLNFKNLDEDAEDDFVYDARNRKIFSFYKKYNENDNVNSTNKKIEENPNKNEKFHEISDKNSSMENKEESNHQEDDDFVHFSKNWNKSDISNNTNKNITSSIKNVDSEIKFLENNFELNSDKYLNKTPSNDKTITSDINIKINDDKNIKLNLDKFVITEKKKINKYNLNNFLSKPIFDNKTNDLTEKSKINQKYLLTENLEDKNSTKLNNIRLSTYQNIYTTKDKNNVNKNLNNEKSNIVEKELNLHYVEELEEIPKINNRNKIKTQYSSIKNNIKVNPNLPNNINSNKKILLENYKPSPIIKNKIVSKINDNKIIDSGDDSDSYIKKYKKQHNNHPINNNNLIKNENILPYKKVAKTYKQEFQKRSTSQNQNDNYDSVNTNINFNKVYQIENNVKEIIPKNNSINQDTKIKNISSIYPDYPTPIKTTSLIHSQNILNQNLNFKSKEISKQVQEVIKTINSTSPSNISNPIYKYVNSSDDEDEELSRIVKNKIHGESDPSNHYVVLHKNLPFRNYNLDVQIKSKVQDKKEVLYNNVADYHMLNQLISSVKKAYNNQINKYKEHQQNFLKDVNKRILNRSNSPLYKYDKKVKTNVNLREKDINSNFHSKNLNEPSKNVNSKINVAIKNKILSKTPEKNNYTSVNSNLKLESQFYNTNEIKEENKLLEMLDEIKQKSTTIQKHFTDKELILNLKIQELQEIIENKNKKEKELLDENEAITTKMKFFMESFTNLKSEKIKEEYKDNNKIPSEHNNDFLNKDVNDSKYLNNFQNILSKNLGNNLTRNSRMNINLSNINDLGELNNEEKFCQKYDVTKLKSFAYLLKEIGLDFGNFYDDFSITENNLEDDICLDCINKEIISDNRNNIN